VAAKVREGANMLPKVVEAEGKCERSHIRCSTNSDSVRIQQLVLASVQAARLCSRGDHVAEDSQVKVSTGNQREGQIIIASLIILQQGCFGT